MAVELKDNDLVFAKVKPNAIIPTKEEENAGRDVYACFDEDYMVIPRHTTKLIPTGIASAMTPKYEIRLRDRGSNGSKGIHVNAGSIDSGFRGEWFVAWCNTNNKYVILSKLSLEELLEKYGQKYDDGEVHIPLNPTEPISDENMLWVETDVKYAPIIYPSLAEQVAISNTLKQIDDEITLVLKIIEERKTQKNAICNLLLTGLVRV